MPDPFDLSFGIRTDPFDASFIPQPGGQSFWGEVGSAFASGTVGLGATATRMSGLIHHYKPENLLARQFGFTGTNIDALASRILAGKAEDLSPEDRRGFGERFSEDPLRALTRAGAGAAPSLIPAVAATAVGGPPAGAVVGGGLGGGSMGLDAFDEAVAQGSDPGTALAIGTSVGVLGGLLDALGAKALLKPASGALARQAAGALTKGSTARLARKLLAGTATEVGTEEAQELISMAGEIAGGRTFAEVSAEAPDRLREAAAGAVVLGGAVGGTSVAGSKYRQRQARRAQIITQHEILEEFAAKEQEENVRILHEAEAGGAAARQELEFSRAELAQAAWPEGIEEDLRGLATAATESVMKPLGKATHLRASFITEEHLSVEKTRRIFGDEIADGLEVAFSMGRVGKVKGKFVTSVPIMDPDGNQIAPALKDLLRPVVNLPESTVADPDPDWIYQWLDPEQAEKARALYKRSPGLLRLEELRWINRELELTGREDVSTPPKIVESVRTRQVFLESLPEYEVLEKAAQDVSRWDHHVLDLWQVAGFKSKEELDLIRAAGPHYAGFYEAASEKETGDLTLINKRYAKTPELFTEVKQGLRKGKLLLPTTAGIQRAQVAAGAVHKQIALNKFHTLVEAAPEIFAAEGIEVAALDKSVAPGKTRLKAWRNGESFPIEMPQDWARAYTSIPLAVNLPWVAAYTSAIKATAIMNPRFAAKSLFRDQPEAKIFAAGHGYKYTPWVDALKGFYHNLRRTPESERARAMGVGFASITSNEIANSVSQLEDVALDVKAEDLGRLQGAMRYGLLRAARAAKAEWKNAPIEHIGAANPILYPFARMGEMIDNASRTGFFLANQEASVPVALHGQRRGLLDFSRSGRRSQQLGQGYAFFNAQTQSFDLNSESARRNPIALLPAIAGLLIVPEMLHFALRHDDEEYQAQNEGQKRRNYYWYRTAEGTWVTSPRSLGWIPSLFGYGFGQILQNSYRKDKGWLGRILGALQDEVPLISLSPVQLDEIGEATFASDFVPEVLTWPVEMWANKKSFFDTPVVPDWMENDPPKERAYRSTPEIYKTIARFLPEKVTPLHVQHTAQTVLGSTGAGAVNVVRDVTGAVKGKGDALTLDSIPAVTAFIARRREAPGLASVQRVFEIVREEKYWASSQPKTPDEWRRKRIWTQVSRQLKVIRALIDQRQAADQFGNFPLRDHFDQQIIEAADDALVVAGIKGEPGSGFAGAAWQRVFGEER